MVEAKLSSGYTLQTDWPLFLKKSLFVVVLSYALVPLIVFKQRIPATLFTVGLVALHVLILVVRAPARPRARPLRPVRQPNGRGAHLVALLQTGTESDEPVLPTPPSHPAPQVYLWRVRIRALDPDWRAFTARLVAIGFAVWLLDLATKLEGGQDVPRLCLNMLVLCAAHCLVLALLTVRVLKRSDQPLLPVAAPAGRAEPLISGGEADSSPAHAAPADEEGPLECHTDAAGDGAAQSPPPTQPESGAPTGEGSGTERSASDDGDADVDRVGQASQRPQGVSSS